MTNEGLLLTRIAGISGEQRLYRWGNWGLSVVNGSMLHSYSFAREAAVVRFTDESGPNDFVISYETPLSEDVEVFSTDEEADAFVLRARDYFASTNLADLEAKAIAAQAEREENRRRMREDFEKRRGIFAGRP